MKILPFQPPFLTQDDANYVRNLFKAGGVIVFPSDTAYGLAADPRNSSAIKKIFAIKQRSNALAISCIFKTLEEARDWAEIHETQEDILKSYLPGLFTFLIPATRKYPLSGMVGLRVPDSDLTRALCEILGAPYTATSANISGRPAVYTIENIVKEFENADVKPDLILDGGVLVVGCISTVVDLTGVTPKIIREGSGRFLPE